MDALYAWIRWAWLLVTQTRSLGVLGIYTGVSPLTDVLGFAWAWFTWGRLTIRFEPQLTQRWAFQKQFTTKTTRWRWLVPCWGGVTGQSLWEAGNGSGWDVFWCCFDIMWDFDRSELDAVSPIEIRPNAVQTDLKPFTVQWVVQNNAPAGLVFTADDDIPF